MTTKTLKLGEHSWEIPPLPFRVLIEIEPLISRITGLSSLLEIALVAIKFVEPEMTKEKLFDMHIPVSDAKAALDIVALQAGLEYTKKGEGQGVTNPPIGT